MRTGDAEGTRTELDDELSRRRAQFTPRMNRRVCDATSAAVTAALRLGGLPPPRGGILRRLRVGQGEPANTCRSCRGQRLTWANARWTGRVRSSCARVQVVWPFRGSTAVVQAVVGTHLWRAPPPQYTARPPLHQLLYTVTTPSTPISRSSSLRDVSAAPSDQRRQRRK